MIPGSRAGQKRRTGVSASRGRTGADAGCRRVDRGPGNTLTCWSLVSCRRPSARSSHASRSGHRRHRFRRQPSGRLHARARRLSDFRHPALAQPDREHRALRRPHHPARVRPARRLVHARNARARPARLDLPPRRAVVRPHLVDRAHRVAQHQHRRPGQPVRGGAQGGPEMPHPARVLERGVRHGDAGRAADPRDQPAPPALALRGEQGGAGPARLPVLDVVEGRLGAHARVQSRGAAARSGVRGLGLRQADRRHREEAPAAGALGREPRGAAGLHRRARHGARLLAGAREMRAGRGLQHLQRQRLDDSEGPRPAAHDDQDEDRGAAGPGAAQAQRRAGAARRQQQVRAGDGLEAHHPVRADAARHAGVLAGPLTPGGSLLRVLVTGLNGFVGPHLQRALTARGDEVHGFGLGPPAPGAPAPASWRSGDILDAAAVGEAVAATRPTHVVHLAGQASAAVSYQKPVETYRVNAIGTWTLLDAVRRNAAEARVLVVGSGEVYGPQPEGSRVAERAPFRPVSPYALSKAAADALSEAFSKRHGLAVVRTRSFGHTGPGQSPVFGLPSVARQIAEIEAGRAAPVLRVGNLEVTRDLTDVRDVVQAYLALLDRARPGAVYNVCRGEGRRLSDVVAHLVARSRVPISVELDPARVRPADLPWLVGNPEAIAADTGWRAAIPLEATLDQVLEEW